jgi:hypothetical protein
MYFFVWVRMQGWKVLGTPVYVENIETGEELSMRSMIKVIVVLMKSSTYVT